MRHLFLNCHSARSQASSSRWKRSHCRSAFTRADALGSLAALALLAAVAGSGLAMAHPRTDRLVCQSNLRQQGRAFQIWSSDHSGQLPWRVSIEQGGTYQHLGKTGRSWFEFSSISNELKSPAYLACPADARATRVAREFSSNPNGGFWHATYRNNAVSYWIALDTYSHDPAQVVSGDRNVRLHQINVGCSSRINNADSIAVDSTLRVEWTDGVHAGAGHVLLVDGSVRFTDSRQATALAQRYDPNSIHVLMPK